MIVRDPVHGDIAVTQLEAEILGCREMQRLRGIRQLGFAHLVYPGCVHTRFDHSLGTLAVARRIMAALTAAGHALSPDDQQVTAAAALIHDITHVPAGHTFEDERQIWPRHDSGQRLAHFLSPETEVGRTLARLGLVQVMQDILSHKGNGHSRTDSWCADIVASTVDADMLDYLRRDSYFAGLHQNYDDRIFHYFGLAGGRLCMNMCRSGQDRPDARSEILHLLRMRYFLTERIYTHHTKLVAGAMVAKAVERCVRHGLQETALYDLSDEGLLQLLSRFPTRRLDPISQSLAADVAARRLRKRAYALSVHTLGEQVADFVQQFAGQSAAREELEDLLSRRAGLPSGSCIVYCPPASLFKEVNVRVRSMRGISPLISLEPATGGEVRALAEQYRQLWRFYVFAPAAQAAAVTRVCQDYFALPSEYLRSAE